MFGDLGTSIGGIHGSATAAKGWKKAQDAYHQYKKDSEANRDYADPFGPERRGQAGDTYWEAMYNPDAIETTGQYQFVRDEALRAAQRQGAAGGYGVGASSSGNVAAALADRASGLASKEYTSIMDRLQNLSGANASYGQNAANMYQGALDNHVSGYSQALVGKYNSYANMQQQAHSTIGQSADIATSFIGMSDARLKDNIKRIGKDGPVNVYSWTWNELASEKFGLTGKDTGYLAQEVKKVMPEAIVHARGYLAIDYGYLWELRENAA